MDTTTTVTRPDEERFRVEWTPGSAVKQVAITDLRTGRRFVGSDWANWDIAYQAALQQAFARRIT